MCYTVDVEVIYYITQGRKPMRNQNEYLSEYFLGVLYKDNHDLGFPTVYTALQRTNQELKRRLSKAEVPVKELNDLWDAVNSFEATIKEHKSDFPTLYRVFEANNFTYI